MKRKTFTRRDFLKLTVAGTAVTVPAVMGYKVFEASNGDPIIQRSPYVENMPTHNPDGSVPILVIVNQDSENRFGIYLAEILRAEGVNCFHSANLSSLQPALLKKYDIVLLAETSLATSQAEIFADYVTHGGRLVGMKPDDRLMSVFGLERSAGTLSEAYIKTEPSHPAGVGINTSTLQLHGSANLYRSASAETIAWLYKDRDTVSDYPAVAVNQFGDGLAVAFAFDLAKSIAYMRQGNPNQVNVDVDGLSGVRTVDMFVNWIDLERIQIPQADEQQRLLINILALLSAGKRPLPRLWYFPEDKKSLLVVTGDSHSNPAQFIEDVYSRVEKRDGHMTVFYAPQIVSDPGRAARLTRFWLTDHVPVVSGILGEEFGSPTPFMVEDWRARGHEFTLHPYVETGLEEWELYWKEFTGRGYGPVSDTVRTHRVLWTGWMETARVQASHGIRMNFDYYHVGPSLQRKNGEWAYGHLTGSGRPMKFIDEQGRMIDLYQQLTQIADEHLIPMDVPGWGGWPNLSGQGAVDVAKYLLDRSVKDGDYCAIGGQFHVDPFQMGGDPAEKGRIYLEGTLDYAQQLGVPAWSAQQWLAFTDLRHESEFTNMNWSTDASTLTFRLLPPEQHEDTLTVLIPTHHNDKPLSSLSVDGVTTSIAARLVLGSVEYAQIIVSAQEHSITSSYS